MSTSGNVEITIVDNGGAGAINVAAPSVVAIFGVSSAGTKDTPISTRSASTLASTFGYGPLTELGAMLIAQGATVIATKVEQSGAGTYANLTQTDAGTSVPSVTLNGTVGAFDTYFVKIVLLSNATVGDPNATVKLKVSLDAGRTYGPTQVLNVSAAPSSLVIPNTGITVSFAAGTLKNGNEIAFATYEPYASMGNVNNAIEALKNSAYAISGWGSMIVNGAAKDNQSYNTADCATLQNKLDSLATSQLFERCFVNVRDAANGWGGGIAETDAQYTSALVAASLGHNAKRVTACAGFYNVPSAIANVMAGTPRYRRPCSWPIQARKSTVAAQVLSSRVKDGPLSMVIVDSTNDPTDGFVYHDERVEPGLDAAGYATLWTRLQQGSGFFVRSENLFSPIGSDFDLFAIGQCFDNFCNTLVKYFTAKIDDFVRTNKNGTIYENDAQALESGALSTVSAAMQGQYQPANTTITIDRTYNVMSNKKCKVSGVFGQLGYIREFVLIVQLQNPLSA